jgi:hypothetical protein
VAGAKLVKVTEELGNTGALLFAEETDAGKHIFNIFRLQFDNFSLNLAGLGPGVVVEGLAVGAADSENTLMGVYFVAEVDIVHLISVTLVHVTSEDKVENCLWGEDTQLSKDTKELTLGDVTALGNIEVLELGLQMDTAVKNGCSIVLKILFHLIFFLLGAFQVLASSSNSILASDWLD